MAQDYSSMTREEMQEELDAIHAEITRRTELESIPEQIEQYAARYNTIGGDITALQAAFDRGKAKKETPPPPAAQPAPTTPNRGPAAQRPV